MTIRIPISATPAHRTPPPAIAQLVKDARHALELDQPRAAIPLLDRALALAPEDPAALYLMGVAAFWTGDRDKAVASLRRALASAPDDAAIHMMLGSVLFEAGAFEEGLAHLRRASELAPGDAEAWYNLGAALEYTCFTLKHVKRMGEARAAFEHALAIDPQHAKARNNLATALIALGDLTRAAEVARETLRLRPDDVDAWAALRNLKGERMTRDDVVQLQGLLARPDTPEDARIVLGFALAKALEDNSDYPAAFDALRRANALKHRQVHWSRDQERVRLDTITRAFAHPPRGASDANLGAGIIFVVCLPRSGATLTEHILASHPQVQAGGETGLLIDILRAETIRAGAASLQWVAQATPADWQRLGESYLERAGELRDGRPRFTDKSVDNWAYVGAALAMLPGAHVVNCRRDPLENCLACYRQLFPVGGDFTYDLDDMADYYAGYERLSALWREQFPRRWLDHDYECLQRNTERAIARLFEFCGLPIEERCLEFHRARRTVLTMSASQVREPIHQDTARAPLYGDSLDALRSRLCAAGVPPTRAMPASGRCA